MNGDSGQWKTLSKLACVTRNTIVIRQTIAKVAAIPKLESCAKTEEGNTEGKVATNIPIPKVKYIGVWFSCEA